MRNGSWIEFYLAERGIGDDLWLSYSTSLHWSLTQFTPASMEIFPRNVAERFFNVGIIVLALLVFSSFVSSITNAMNHIRNINATNTEQETRIRRYFRENSIHHDLASRVWHFVRNNRKVNVRRLRLAHVTSLEGLPIRLKDELLQAQHLPVMQRHPFFKLYLPTVGASMKKRCVQLAIQEADPLASGGSLEAIMVPGKVAKSTGLRNESYVVKKMVFCLFGSLEYNDPNGEVIDDDPGCIVSPGEWACEAALWLQEATLQGRLVAGSSGCDALLVDADAFRIIAKEDVETHHYVAKYAVLFTNLFTDAMQMSVGSDLGAVEEEAEEKPGSTNILFNDPEVLEPAARDAFTDSHKHGSIMLLGAIKGFSQRNSKMARSSTRSGRGSTSTAEPEESDAASLS
ncbi:unnamed protein product [Prorocentrum cordatum]|uniref:Cyclic nucleotide-binding domain-containing protein n=1 Tax=Prorocentrum cordatum TaxID=2364126 RepID=A0ABN9SDH4_9DINO|nr:unnamed protein product [Polarella glacialis]